MIFTDPQVLAFTGLAAILTITPGADTLLVVRSVLARGQRAGFIATAGICAGLFVHATLSAAGLSLILVNSARAFEVLKLAGAGYLVFLGGQSIWRLVKPAAQKNTTTAETGTPPDPSAVTSFFEGVINNVLNPKAAVFYLAFLPQFIDPGDPVFTKSLLLAGIHFALSLAWLSIISLFIGRMRTFFASSRVHRWLEALSGTILIGLGIRLAMEKA